MQEDSTGISDAAKNLEEEQQWDSTLKDTNLFL